jgi:hypothetical protein
MLKKLNPCKQHQHSIMESHHHCDILDQQQIMACLAFFHGGDIGSIFSMLFVEQHDQESLRWHSIYWRAS